MRRLLVFEQMLQRALPAGPPPDQRKTLDMVKKSVSEITQLRGSSVDDQRKLEGLDQKAREGRERFGRAVDALGVDASKARDEARNAREGVAPYTEAVKQARLMTVQVHGEVLHWEGRSGHAVPYRELAAVYRKTADLVDHWVQTVDLEKQAIAWAESKEQEVIDLDFQIQQPRAQLGKVESTSEQEHAAIEQRVMAAGKKAAELEETLLFSELETESVAA